MSKSLPVAIGFASILCACAHGPQFRDFGVTTGNVANAIVRLQDGGRRSSQPRTSASALS
jgi:hypothetical protein